MANLLENKLKIIITKYRVSADVHITQTQE